VNIRRFNFLIWFGILGGPMAWAGVHVAGYAFGLAQCDDPASRWQLPVHAWDVAFAAAGVTIAVVAEAVCVWIFRRTRTEDNDPPVARLHFLSVIGLTVNPLALAIMVMTGIGTSFLSLCHQS
jgi:heme/copper-type cytochrome/quinol oxidase subunit 2